MKQVFAFLLIFLKFLEILGLQCMDERSNPVDWIMAYKLPALHNENKLTEEGLSYMYITSTNYSRWTLSNIPINETNSLIANILYKLYDREKNYTFILYNDETPDGKKTQKGHNKGVVLTDDVGGLWLLHSVPKFPSLQTYNFPGSGTRFGQSFLCISLKLEDLDKVGIQLQYNEPNIYGHNIENNIKHKLPNLAAAAANVTVKYAPWFSQMEIDSLWGTKFISFAKSKNFGKDLYEDWVALALLSDLYVETWVDGPGRLPSNCTKRFTVRNVQSIFVPELNVTFTATHDHSKWAVSVPNEAAYWLCVGDINRAEHQEKRGGGTVCLENEYVSNNYRELVKNVEECN